MTRYRSYVNEHQAGIEAAYKNEPHQSCPHDSDREPKERQSWLDGWFLTKQMILRTRTGKKD